MSMQQIMIWGHDFPKDKEGEIFNLWGHWGKAKCQLINPFGCHLSFVLLTLYPLSHSTTFLSYSCFNYQIKSSGVSWGSYCMDSGVAGLSVLSHMHTPPRILLTLTWGGESTTTPHSSIFTHVEN